MNDLISRQAAIDLVRDVCNAVMSGCESRYDPETEDEVYKDILEVDAILKCNKEVRIALCNMPSAQPERMRGRWIMNDNGTYSCSECHSWIPNEQHYYARYCLYCGAKMDEVEE